MSDQQLDQQLLTQCEERVKEIEGLKSTKEMAEWMSNILCVKYIMIDTTRKYLGCVIILATSPNIWWDTKNDILHGTWGGAKYELNCSNELLDEYLVYLNN